jgi:hypothetical protein
MPNEGLAQEPVRGGKLAPRDSQASVSTWGRKLAAD